MTVRHNRLQWLHCRNYLLELPLIRWLKDDPRVGELLD